MVDRNKKPNIACSLKVQFIPINDEIIAFVDVLKYGRREFQINSYPVYVNG
jgi:hypothetical protein